MIGELPDAIAFRNQPNGYPDTDDSPKSFICYDNRYTEINLAISVHINPSINFSCFWGCIKDYSRLGFFDFFHKP